MHPRAHATRNPQIHAADGWLPHPATADSSIEQQYWLAIMWAVSATTSVGMNIVPKYETEAIFSVVMILLGLVMYSVIIGAASSALSSSDADTEERKAALDRVMKYMRMRKVPPFFQKIVKGEGG